MVYDGTLKFAHFNRRLRLGLFLSKVQIGNGNFATLANMFGPEHYSPGEVTFYLRRQYILLGFLETLSVSCFTESPFFLRIFLYTFLLKTGTSCLRIYTRQSGQMFMALWKLPRLMAISQHGVFGSFLAGQSKFSHLLISQQGQSLLSVIHHLFPLIKWPKMPN